MNKIVKLFLIMLALQSCSYEPILTNKNYDFQFEEIKYEGEKKVNREIERNLRNFNKGALRYDIFFKTRKVKKIISSDSKGDPKIYKINIYIEYIVSNNGETILENNTNNQFTYNNINDKYELSKYEDSILKNLSNNISEDILFSLKVLK